MIYSDEDLDKFETRICRVYDLIATRSNISGGEVHPFAFNASIKRVHHKQRFEIIFYWYPNYKVPKKYLKRQRIFIYYHEMWCDDLYGLMVGRMVDKYDNSILDLAYMLLRDEEVYELTQ